MLQWRGYPWSVSFLLSGTRSSILSNMEGVSEIRKETCMKEISWWLFPGKTGNRRLFLAIIMIPLIWRISTIKSEVVQEHIYPQEVPMIIIQQAQPFFRLPQYF